MMLAKQLLAHSIYVCTVYTFGNSSHNTDKNFTNSTEQTTRYFAFYAKISLWDINEKREIGELHTEIQYNP